MRYALILILLAGCSMADGSDCSNMRGDVDGDGSIAPHDASLALDIESGDRKPTKCELQAADFDEDGKVTIDDANAILALWVGGG